MLRNRYRKNTTTVPFRIRNNFRRLSMLDILSQEKVQFDNDDNETMSLDETLQKDSDDDEIISQISGQRSKGENHDDYYEEREYDYAASSENEVEHNDDYCYKEREYDYSTSSESEEENDANTLPEIVDAALDEDKLPSFDGVFAPYFQDFITAALFCWIHKHNISTNAYEDLVDIIKKPEFNKDH